MPPTFKKNKKKIICLFISFVCISVCVDRPWWPSSLSWHAITQLIVATKGPGFESPLGITILIAKKYKYFVTFQIAGFWITCVAYDTFTDHSLLLWVVSTVPYLGFLAKRLNGRVWAPNPGGRSPHHKARIMSSDVG